MMIENWPTNWLNGMKVGATHLLHDQVSARWYASYLFSIQNSNPYQYGLIHTTETTNPLSFDIDYHTVRLIHCFAICPDGQLMYKTDNPLWSEISANLMEIRSGRSEFVLALQIVPRRVHAVGEADANELPPRIPYAAPYYQLTALDMEALDQSALYPSLIPIGIISYEGERFILQEDYIPPVTTVMTHPSLRTIYYETIQFMNSIIGRSREILASPIYQSSQDAIKRNQVLLARELWTFLGGQYHELRTWLPFRPPVDLFLFYVKLASFVNIVLNTMPAQSATFEYFANWTQSSVNDFNAIIDNTIAAQYNHSNIRKSFVPALHFRRLLDKLLQVMGN